MRVAATGCGTRLIEDFWRRSLIPDCGGCTLQLLPEPIKATIANLRKYRPNFHKFSYISLNKKVLHSLLIGQNQASSRCSPLNVVQKGDVRQLRFGCGTFVARQLFHAACEIHKSYLPKCAIHPSFTDSAQLATEVVTGKMDAAIVTLPIETPELCVKELLHDWLVVCLRATDPLAAKVTLRPADFADRLAILYDPERHAAAHARLAELLAEAGVHMEAYSRASHPTEIQDLVLGGYGFALIREGTELRTGLITRPISGVTWTVDTAFIYHNERFPKVCFRQICVGQKQ